MLPSSGYKDKTFSQQLTFEANQIKRRCSPAKAAIIAAIILFILIISALLIALLIERSTVTGDKTQVQFESPKDATKISLRPPAANNPTNNNNKLSKNKNKQNTNTKNAQQLKKNQQAQNIRNEYDDAMKEENISPYADNSDHNNENYDDNSNGAAEQEDYNDQDQSQQQRYGEDEEQEYQPIEEEQEDEEEDNNYDEREPIRRSKPVDPRIQAREPPPTMKTTPIISNPPPAARSAIPVNPSNPVPLTRQSASRTVNRPKLNSVPLTDAENSKDEQDLKKYIEMQQLEMEAVKAQQQKQLEDLAKQNELLQEELKRTQTQQQQAQPIPTKPSTIVQPGVTNVLKQKLTQAKAALQGKNPYIIDFTDASLESTLTQSTATWILEFYLPECPHCIDFQPIYESVAKYMNTQKDVELSEPLSWGRIDCKANPEAKDIFNIVSFPTVLLLRDNGRKVIKFKGDNTADDLLKFLYSSGLIIPPEEDDDDTIQNSQANKPPELQHNVKNTQQTAPRKRLNPSARNNKNKLN